ncbi:MAG: proprotein convertase P-domain-containing protein, partial [Planctomycetota bacterium]
QTRRAFTDHIYAQRRGPELPAPPVIYGDDDRVDPYAETDPNLLALTDSICVIVSTSELSDNGDGTYTLSTDPWTFQSGASICADEPFRGQETIGFCSGFFLGGDLVGSAGHCVDGGDVGNTAVLFAYKQIDATTAPEMVVPADRVYFITSIVDQELGGGDDHSIFQVDRPVTGRAPLPLSRDGAPPVGTDLVVIGHPAALPMKIAGGAQLQSVQSGFFQSNLDTYGGNSGSAVFNANTLEIEGILVRGAPDYTSGPGGCTQSNRVPDTGNTGGGLTFEECSLAATFAGFVPELGLSVTPPAGAYHIGQVGGPFAPADQTYTLRNPTSNPLDYAVSLSGSGLLHLDPADAAGTIGAGAEVDITIGLESGVSSLAAGVYTETITFDDITNAESLDRTHTVEIGQSIVSVTPAIDLQSSGPIGGPFPGSETYTVTNDRPVPTTVTVTADAVWLAVNGGKDDTISLSANGATGDAIISVTAAANGLGAGLYTGTITFTNNISGATETRLATLDVGRLSANSTDTPISIPDNNSSGITSVITMPSGFCVADVDVDVDISHTFQGDLIVELTSPEGTTVRLHNRTGGTTDNLMETYDDDGAGIPAGGPGSLGDFVEDASGGAWTLFVSDNAGSDVGSLNSWTLRIGVSGSSCPPRALDVAGAGPIHLPVAIQLDGVSNAGLPLDYVITSLPSDGVLWENGVGPITSTPHTIPGVTSGPNLTFRPNLGFSGASGFDYFVEDTLTSQPATASISISSDGVVYDFPMDTDPGWSAEGAWAFGDPTGGDDPSGGFTGASVYGYALGGDYASNINTTHWLTTEPMDLSGVTGSELRFQRFLGVERSLYDHVYLDISNNDGATWSQLWENPDSTINETAWTEVTFDISAVADGASAVRFRWGLGTTDGSVQFHGWNIDDVQIIADVQSPAADMTTEGTANGVPDGAVTLSDFSFYLSQWSSGEPQADITTTGTSNLIADAAIDLSDFSAYLSLWSGGN